MITIRKNSDRGHSSTDWLESYHTFSFDEYYDPDFMGYSVLRVINEDTVKPNHGFNKHPHKNMEIITYIISGELKHGDSLGTGSVIKPGEIQRMSAGTGVEHSEYNHSKNNSVHLLQIWIKPNQPNLPPSYEQKSIAAIKNQLILIGGPESSENSVMIHQDAKLYLARLDQNKTINYNLDLNRKLWIQLITGQLEINQQLLTSGDGAAIQDEASLLFKSLENTAEFLVFDLP